MAPQWAHVGTTVEPLLIHTLFNGVCLLNSNAEAGKTRAFLGREFKSKAEAFSPQALGVRPLRTA